MSEAKIIFTEDFTFLLFILYVNDEKSDAIHNFIFGYGLEFEKILKIFLIQKGAR